MGALEGVALLAEGVDRNVRFAAAFPRAARSPSSRRAWIEIFELCPFTTISAVALLAEGVDRNINRDFGKVSENLSPSSRRAWIEITVTRLS